jgi:hypothetical protein
MTLGDTPVPSEADEDSRATAWTILWAKALIALGIICLCAIAACGLIWAVSCPNPSRTLHANS